MFDKSVLQYFVTIVGSIPFFVFCHWPKNADQKTKKISCHFQAKYGFFTQKINKQDRRFFRCWSFWPKYIKRKMGWTGQMMSWVQSQFFMSKIIQIFLNFFHWRISIKRHVFCYCHFLKTSIFKALYLLK